MRSTILGIAIIGLLTTVAWGQDADWTACNNSLSNPRDGLVGCTSIVQRDGEPIKQKAIAFARRGIAYEALNDGRHAIADLGEAIRLDPDFPNWRYQRARVFLEKTHNTRMAIEDINAALLLRPNDATYLKLRAQAMQEMTNAARESASKPTPTAPELGAAKGSAPAPSKSFDNSQAQSAPAQGGEDCVFRDQIAAELDRTSAKELEIGKKAAETLTAIDTLVGKAKKTDIPISKQLTPADLAMFNSMQENLKSQQIVVLLERRRNRDFQVINKMVAIADQSYRYGIEPAEGHPDFRVLSSLRIVRAALEKKALEISLPTNNCSLDGSIYELEGEATAKIAKLDFASLEGMSNQLRTKYKMGVRIEREKLSQDDQQDWDDVSRGVAIPAQRAKSFLLDLEAARNILHASEIIYATDGADASSSGGKMSSVGLTMGRRIEANEFNETVVASIGLLRLLNETDVLR
jgi:hypothetical protein